MTVSQQPLNDLDRRWTEAEVDGDATTLDALATDDFTTSSSGWTAIAVGACAPGCCASSRAARASTATRR
jgi:hypothetical protein